MNGHLTHAHSSLTAYSYSEADIDSAIMQAADCQTVNKLTLYPPPHSNTLPAREQITMITQQGQGVTISLTIGDTTTSTTFTVTRPDHATALHDLGQHITHTAGMIETE